MSTLALKGGERAFTGSYVGWHLYGEADAAGLKAVADSGKIANGAAVEKFISEFSEFTVIHIHRFHILRTFHGSSSRIRGY